MAYTTDLVYAIYGKDKTASKALKGVGKESKNLGEQFKHMGKVAAASFAVVGAAAGAFAMSSIKNAIEDEKSQRRLAVALKNTVGATQAQTAAVEDYISKTQARYGIVDDKLRPSLQRLLQSTKDITEAEKLQGLAISISAGTGKDLESVSNALGKAYGGNLASLQRLGLGLDKSIIKNKDTKAAFEMLFKTFTGQGEAAADSLEGRFQRLKIAQDEVKEQIGYALLPYVQKFADYLTDTVVPNVQSFVDGLTGVKNSGGDAYDSVYKLGEKIRGIVEWMAQHQKTVEIFAGVIATIWAVNKIQAGVTATIAAVNSITLAYGRLTGAATAAAEAEAAANAAGAGGGGAVAGKLAKVGKLVKFLPLAGLAVASKGALQDPTQNAEVAQQQVAYMQAKMGWTKKKAEAWAKSQNFAGYRAVGGSLARGVSYMVGEHGPEMFTPSTSGVLTRNENLGRVGGGVTVVVNVHGSVVQEKDLAVAVRDNIAQLMRRKGLNPAILGV